MACEVMLKKFDEMILQNKCLKKEKENTEKKLGDCQQELSHSKKTIDSINRGKAKLDEILTVGRPSRAKHGIGYVGESSSVKKDNSQVVFLKSNNQHVKKDKFRRRQRREVLVCFYCRESGHIRPKCNKMKEDLKSGKNSWI